MNYTLRLLHSIFPSFSCLLMTLILFVLFLSIKEVFSIQSFLREPFDQIAIVGEHVTLPCRVVGKKGELQWTRDDFGLGVDRNLTGFKRYTMIGSEEENDWTLDINPVSLEDDAKFQCQVGAAESVTPIRSRYAILTVLVPPKIPRLVPGDEFLTIVEGQQVEIKCESLGGKPASEITWLNDNNEVIHSGVTAFTELMSDGKRSNTVSTLTFIASAEQHHLKNISCQAQNSANRQPMSTSLRLNVQFSPQVQLRALSSTSLVPEGQSLRLQCSASGNPSPLIYSWFISGRRIDDTSSNDYVIDSVDRRLHKQVIQCSVQNLIGKTEESLSLNVGYPPLFLSRPENMAGELGDKVTLRCKVDSNPSPLITWTHQNLLVGHSENLTVSINEAHIGEYTCKALVTGYESISAKATVFMKRAPIILESSTPYEVFSSIGETSSLSCNAISVPPVEELSWNFNGHILNSELGQYSILENRSNTGVRSTLVIRKTFEEDFGSYTCIVKNKLGSNSAITHLRQKTSLPLLVIIVAVIGGIILSIAVILIVIVCRRNWKRNNKKLEDLLTVRKEPVTVGDRVSNNSSDIKIEVRTSSSLSQEDWENISYKNSCQPDYVDSGGSQLASMVMMGSYHVGNSNNILYSNYRPGYSSSSPLMNGDSNYYPELPGVNFNGYERPGGGGNYVVCPPVEQSTPRHSDFDSYCVYVNSSESHNNIGKTSSLATHV